MYAAQAVPLTQPTLGSSLQDVGSCVSLMSGSMKEVLGRNKNMIGDIGFVFNTCAAMTKLDLAGCNRVDGDQ